MKFRTLWTLLAVAGIVSAGSGCRQLPGPLQNPGDATPSALSSWRNGQAAGDAWGPSTSSPSLLARATAGFQAATAKVWPGDGDAETAASLAEPKDVLSLANMPAQPSPRLLVAAAAFKQAQGASDAAHTRYLDALEVDPNYLPAHLGLARLRISQGHLALGLEQYEKALQLHPHDATLHNDLGLALMEDRQLQRAAEHLQRAVESSPREPRYRNNLARVFVQLDRVDDAQATLAETVGPAASYYNVAYLLAEQGRFATALPLLRKSLELNPQLQPAQEMMQQLALDRAAPANTAQRQGPAASSQQ